jgi:hypothetical protein
LRFSPDTVMLHANPITHLIQQFWRLNRRRCAIYHNNYQCIIGINMLATFYTLYAQIGCLLVTDFGVY